MVKREYPELHKTVLEISKTMVGKNLVFILEGRLDVISGSRLQEQLMNSIASPDGCKCILLDFAKLTYISSAGIRVLWEAQKAAVAQEKSIELCNVSGRVRGILDLVGIRNIMSVQESPDSE